MDEEISIVQERKNKCYRTYKKQINPILVNTLSFQIRRITRTDL